MTFNRYCRVAQGEKYKTYVFCSLKYDIAELPKGKKYKMSVIYSIKYETDSSKTYSDTHIETTTKTPIYHSPDSASTLWLLRVTPAPVMSASFYIFKRINFITIVWSHKFIFKDSLIPSKMWPLQHLLDVCHPSGNK